MYLKLDVIQPKIEEWIRESYKKGNWSANSIVDTEGEIVEGRLRTGLKPSPVTRDLEWGVPVPIEGEDIYGMKDKVLCKFARFRSCVLILILLDVWVRIHYFLLMMTNVNAHPQV